jgi:hypothetical protein
MRTRTRRFLLVIAFLAGPLAVIAAWQIESRSDSDAPRAIPSVHATGLQRKTIYHSPQTPGYTSWVGAWTLPGGDLMTAFVQATGEVDPARRERAPAAVLGAFARPANDPAYDFWGLSLSVQYLRSSDDGANWDEYRSDPFHALIPQAYTPQATIELEDGTLLRRVNGDDLRNDSKIPHTAYLQRLEPSSDTWGAPQVMMDPSRYTYQVTRLRYLRDRRIIATGNYWKVPATTPSGARANAPSKFLLMVSSDKGKTWQNGLTIPPDAGYAPGNEWDTAELPNGDLAAVMRTAQSPSNPAPARKQALLEKRGNGWVLTRLRNAPFPPSGHPELLTTREGPVLHIATTGIDYTKDGVTWKPLRFEPTRDYHSTYYPRALQTSDGVVHVFGHIGADDGYGSRDQSIVMDTFRLVADPSPES